MVALIRLFVTLQYDALYGFRLLIIHLLEYTTSTYKKAWICILGIYKDYVP